MKRLHLFEFNDQPWVPAWFREYETDYLHTVLELLVLLLTPAIRPFSWRRLFFTYLLPALPLAIWWDGLVSNLRAYTPHELEAMTRPLNDARYRFEAKALGSGAVRITCVLGRPGR